MQARYVCGEEGRRRAVRDSAGALNGIDFVEVSEDQLTLSIHFLKTPIPDGIGLENVVIEGGSGSQTSALPGWQSWTTSLMSVSHARGDFSRYALWLVSVDGLDPRLSRVSSFPSRSFVPPTSIASRRIAVRLQLFQSLISTTWRATTRASGN